MDPVKARVRVTGETLLAAKADKKPVIDVPDATDLPSALTLLNAIKGTINAMNVEVPEQS